MVSENEEIEYINTFYKHLDVYITNTSTHKHHQSRYNEFGEKDTLNFIYEGERMYTLKIHRINKYPMHILYR